MNKLNVLLKCIPKSPLKEALTTEINALKAERNQYKADAKKFEWLLINSNKWSWMPSQSGFTANSSGYLGYSFSDALKLAMRKSKGN